MMRGQPNERHGGSRIRAARTRLPGWVPVRWAEVDEGGDFGKALHLLSEGINAHAACVGRNAVQSDVAVLQDLERQEVRVLLHEHNVARLGERPAGQVQAV
eukprot:scaffold3428_cov379-Prasinococcus_capsulatus_cf.AAC.18